jgi:hypothetical protein
MNVRFYPKSITLADLDRINNIAFERVLHVDAERRALSERHPDLGPILVYDHRHDEFKADLPDGLRILILSGDGVRRAIYRAGAIWLVAAQWLTPTWHTTPRTRDVRIACRGCWCVEEEGTLRGAQDCYCRCHR